MFCLYASVIKLCDNIMSQITQWGMQRNLQTLKKCHILSENVAFTVGYTYESLRACFMFVSRMPLQRP